MYDDDDDDGVKLDMRDPVDRMVLFVYVMFALAIAFCIAANG